MKTQWLQPTWEYVADTVMGGVSKGGLTQQLINGQDATVLKGTVSLDNNGGFIQMAFDLQQDGFGIDASAWDGVILDVCGSRHSYDLRLRTDDLTRPWQSFRAAFATNQAWQTVRISFDTVVPHKTEAVFDASKLRRVGILAIGKAFDAQIAVARIGFYQDTENT